jgi:UDP-N-acetylmuramate-alanine ligase
MLDAFAEALSDGDEAVIADIWAGRDQDTTSVQAHHLAEAVTARGRVTALAPGSVDATARTLAGAVQPGEAVLVMGGGRSYVIARELVRLLSG